MIQQRLVLLAIVAVFSMSAVPVLIKSVSANEVSIALVRLAIAIAVLTPFVIWQADLRQRTLRELAIMFAIGILFAAHWLTYFASIKLSTASLGALAISTFGVQYLILARIFNKIPISRLDALGVCTCFAGCVVVTPSFALDNDVSLGLLIGVFSGTLYAALPLLHQRIAEVPTLTRTWCQFSFAALCILPFFPKTDWALSQTDWWILLLLGLLCTVIAHGLWVKVTTELSPRFTSLIYYLYVPLAMASSALLLNEEMSVEKLAGAALILGASVGVTAYRLRSEAAE